MIKMPTFYKDADGYLSAETRKSIGEQIKADIEAYSVKTLTDEHRNHLGASIIGKECAREAWYIFRWVKFQVFDGRMLRLFDRGKKEEANFVNLLRAIGCQVWEVDPITGKQFRIYGVKGHFGGSLDSGGLLPYLPDFPILMEFKTHNTKSFTNLVNKGLILSKPQHYSQMCSYGAHYKFRYGLYVAINKNDDDIWPELVELDWKRAHDLENKAQDIIESQFPPQRISDNPAYFACKWCFASEICHNNAPVEINCRSCKCALPVENGEWRCTRFDAIIPGEYIKKGCEFHVSVNI
jgi:hypothetical protein